MFTILFTPFNILYRLLTGSFSLFGYLFPFLPRLFTNVTHGSTPARPKNGRRSLNPRDTASRFAREFEEEYGSHRLEFFDDGYAQAYDKAKQELKFLIVVLLSPEHDDTSTFVRNTLLSQEFLNYLHDSNNKVILWAGNVQDSEAYQVSNALNCSKFPFAALIVHTPQDSSTSMSTIARLTGLQPASAFVAKLRSAVDQHSQALDIVRATRNEQQASRNLRNEQNSAYERSLAQDRERVRQRREAEALRQNEEAEARAKVEAQEQENRNFEQWKRWRAQSLPKEPGAETKNAARISIRLTNGDRVVRKFAHDAEMEELYVFVECYDVLILGEDTSSAKEPAGYNHNYDFRLVSPMPRTVYEINDGGTVGSNVGRSGNLIVEPINNEEDDE